MVPLWRHWLTLHDDGIVSSRRKPQHATKGTGKPRICILSTSTWQYMLGYDGPFGGSSAYLQESAGRKPGGQTLLQEVQDVLRARVHSNLVLCIWLADLYGNRGFCGGCFEYASPLATSRWVLPAITRIAGTCERRTAAFLHTRCL